jgi:hypothetical protein
MKKIALITFASVLLCCNNSIAQLSPAITNWLINTTGIQGRHYVSGNPTPITDNVLANVQTVQYSNNWVYVSTKGIPAYITGPFLDGNPSLAQNQNAIFKISLNPVQNTGTPTATTMGNIGVFINGVALFDARDGVSWKNSSNALAGGPLGGQGDNIWNRDAIRAERAGFDCSKGHPAMGNYHHHQNPSAFKLDLNVISNICDIYVADGLYAIDSTQHSPLLGYAYDGFPIYGAYGYKNADGSGGIVRIKSSYQLRNITVRTHLANGNDVLDGPPVNSTYPIGYFCEDYEFINHSEDDYLDVHNGRFCVTPEYPNGTYAYFCTVDANWNSAYPYCIGPTFYGVSTAQKVNSISEQVTTYNPTTTVQNISIESVKMQVYPNPANDVVIVQLNQVVNDNIVIGLFTISGQLVAQSTIFQGSTLAYFDTRTLYNGNYLIRSISSNPISNNPIQITINR